MKSENRGFIRRWLLPPILSLTASLFSTPSRGEENGSEEVKHDRLWVCSLCFHFLTFVTFYYLKYNAKHNPNFSTKMLKIASQGLYFLNIFWAPQLLSALIITTHVLQDDSSRMLESWKCLLWWYYLQQNWAKRKRKRKNTKTHTCLHVDVKLIQLR